MARKASVFFTAILQCPFHGSNMINPYWINEWMSGFDMSFKIQSLLEGIQENHIILFT